MSEAIHLLPQYAFIAWSLVKAQFKLGKTDYYFTRRYKQKMCVCVCVCVTVKPAHKN
jgi:hypothetical protein